MVGLRPRIAELPRQTIALHIGQYDQWRLRLPTEDRAKAPRLKVAAPRQVEAHPQVLVFHDPSKKIDYNNYDLSLDKVFFWARWVPFSGPPGVVARAPRRHCAPDELLALFQDRGFSVDKNMLKFDSPLSELIWCQRQEVTDFSSALMASFQNRARQVRSVRTKGLIANDEHYKASIELELVRAWVDGRGIYGFGAQAIVRRWKIECVSVSTGKADSYAVLSMSIGTVIKGLNDTAGRKQDRLYQNYASHPADSYGVLDLRTNGMYSSSI
ncbi:hypothetical protein B0H10DRAFT_1951451 [Mycena sp. CBHHK59/15]|nr:hypothetical protein B0H10DRAFT_1951451 [Mycena sp. CBHHK59/15]